MSVFRKVFNFYLDASIHVALAVLSLYFISIEKLNISTNWSLAMFLFFGTIVCYNFIKYGVEAEKYLIVSNPYHKVVQAFSFISFAFACMFFFQFDKGVWLAILALTAISGLYAIPLLPKLKNLRSLGGSKTFLVALVWMGCTVLLPVLDNGIPFGWDVCLLMFQRFLLVLILLLPFEIRDMKLDNPKLKTIPQRIGVAQTINLGYFLTFFYFVSNFLLDDFDKTWIGLELVLCAFLILVLFRTKGNQNKYFAAFWVEAIPMVFLLLVLIIENRI